MKIQLCSILLNEVEWLEANHRQHREWPGLANWTLVECCDRTYAACNPSLVTAEGLSTDGTTDLLDDIARRDPRVTVIHHGWMDHPNLEQAKCVGRNRYLQHAEAVKPDWLAVIDIDEMYAFNHQAHICDLLATLPPWDACAIIRQRHIWRPPSVAYTPLFSQEVVGGYWAVPHCRFWRWQPGLRHKANHNWLETADGQLQNKLVSRLHLVAGTPDCVHLGFASKGRHAKSAYYRARGETLSRRTYVDCRSAHEVWKPGDQLPHGAKVIEYRGPVPETFLEVG